MLSFDFVLEFFVYIFLLLLVGVCGLWGFLVLGFEVFDYLVSFDYVFFVEVEEDFRGGGEHFGDCDVVDCELFGEGGDDSFGVGFVFCEG